MTAASPEHRVARFFFRLLGILVTAATLAACYRGWVESLEGPQSVVARRPNEIRVHLSSGAAVELYGAFIVGDSLGGYRGMTTDKVRFTVPLSDVQAIDIQDVPPKPSLRSVLAIAVFATILAAVLAVYWSKTFM